MSLATTSLASSVGNSPTCLPVAGDSWRFRIIWAPCARLGHGAHEAFRGFACGEPEVQPKYAAAKIPLQARRVNREDEGGKSAHLTGSLHSIDVSSRSAARLTLILSVRCRVADRKNRAFYNNEVALCKQQKPERKD